MSPFAPELLIETGVIVRGPGVCDRDAGSLPSPSRTNVSIVRSKLPLQLFNISWFFLLSPNPISRSFPSFSSKLLLTLVILLPKRRDVLLVFCGLEGPSYRSSPLKVGDSGGVIRSRFGRGNVELAERTVNPNRLVGFGGRAGPSSFHEPVPVLPVLCLIAGDNALPPDKRRCSYF